MTLCACGCGKEIAEGKRFANGHYAKWKSQQRKLQLSGQDNKTESVNSSKPSMNAPVTGLLKHEEKIKPIEEPKKISGFRWPFSKKVKTEKVQVSPEVLVQNLPRWSISERKPFSLFRDKTEKYIQFVGFSRIKPAIFCWVKWDGVTISVDHKCYDPPHDIRGDVFAYDLDKGKPLLDAAESLDGEKDPEYEANQRERIKNMYYLAGFSDGASPLLKNLSLLLILMIVVIMAVGGLIYVDYLNYKQMKILIDAVTAIKAAL